MATHSSQSYKESYTNDPAQIIEAHYLDHRKLVRLLKQAYPPTSNGENNFRVEVRLLSERWNVRVLMVAVTIE